MYVSDEAGFYKEGAFGIRLESDIISVAHTTKYQHGARPWLKFDYMTMVPFCPNLIDQSLLSPAEIASIDNYHADVRKSITPLLTPAAAKWLHNETAPLAERGQRLE